MRQNLAILLGAIGAGGVFAYGFPGLLLPIGISKLADTELTALSLVIMTIVMTACMLPLALVAGHLHRGTAHLVLKLTLLLPAAWVMSEWLRSVVFSLFLYGPGASIGDYWNFGSLGMGVMNTPLAYGSRVAGMYGLTFLVVALVGAACYALIYKKVRTLVITIAAVFVLSAASVLLYQKPAHTGKNGYHASVMQQHERYSFQENLPYIEPQTDSAKDLIVLPEYSDAFERGNEALASGYINPRLDKDGVSVTVSEGHQKKRYGTLEFRDNTGEVVDTQTKKLLIPTGEYMPDVLKSILIVSHKPSVLDAFKRVKKVEVGTGPHTYKKTNSDLVIGPVACSGILGRNIYRELARSGAGVFTNSASLVVFNNSGVYFKQSIQMAKFHAIANDRLFIQASKGAQAFVLDEDGKYVVAPTDSESRFIDFDFSANYQKTIYTVVGEWVLWLSAAICLWALSGRQIKRNLRIFSRK